MSSTFTARRMEMARQIHFDPESHGLFDPDALLDLNGLAGGTR